MQKLYFLNTWDLEDRTYNFSASKSTRVCNWSQPNLDAYGMFLNKAASFTFLRYLEIWMPGLGWASSQDSGAVEVTE